MAALHGVGLCAFDAAGLKAKRPTAFLTVSSDNRLKLWDILTGNLRASLTEPNHLAAQYTCLALSRLQNGKAQSATKRAASTATQSIDVAAIGTRSGSIILWDLNSGQVLHRLSGVEGHSLAVNDVVFSSDGTRLYSAADDKRVVCWDVPSGKVLSSFVAGHHPVILLALRPDDAALLTVSGGIKLWDLASQQVLKKFSGHATPVQALSFSADGHYFLSAAKSDRFLNLWDARVDADAASSKQKRALHTFALDSTPINVQFQPDVNSSAYQFVCTTDTGAVSLWSWSSDDDSSNTAAPDSTALNGSAPSSIPLCRITVAKVKADTASSESSRVNSMATVLPPVRACFVNASDSPANSSIPELLVVRGSLLRPVFQKVALQDDTGAIKSSIKLQPLNSAVRAAGDAAAGAGLARKRKEPSSLSTNVNLLDGADGVLPASVQTGRLSGKVARKSKAADSIASASTSAETEATDAEQKGTPSAGSLQVLLSQALHTGDDTTIEFCLARRDAQSIAKTVDRLPTPDVLPLLSRLVDKFQTKPARGLELVPWINSILTRHTSYLLSVPNLSQHLSRLYTTVDTRLAVFKKLLKLGGRLNLMLSQISVRNASSSTQGAGPVAVMAEDDPEEDDKHTASEHSGAVDMNGIADDDDDDDDLDVADDDEDGDDMADAMETDSKPRSTSTGTKGKKGAGNGSTGVQSPVSSPKLKGKAIASATPDNSRGKKQKAPSAQPDDDVISASLAESASKSFKKAKRRSD